jgi:lipoate-protein ligase A
MGKVGHCTHKVPNGKLLKITVEFSDNILKKVQIKGDFFIYPEESLDELEVALTNKEYSRVAIGDIVGDFFEKPGIVAFGITPKSVVDAILKCKENTI